MNDSQMNDSQMNDSQMNEDNLFTHSDIVYLHNLFI